MRLFQYYLRPSPLPDLKRHFANLIYIIVLTKAYGSGNIRMSTSITTATSNTYAILPFLAGTAFGIASSILYASVVGKTSSSSSTLLQPPSTLPQFAKDIILLQSNHTNSDNDNDNNTKNVAVAAVSDWTEVRLREWEDLKWRDSNGWQGRDLCHNPQGLGVRILHYYYSAALKELVGVVWFGPHAESHRGLCHGGAMTLVMDDLCGHLAFLQSKNGPWSGATVQVNVSLKKPVPIGSTLRIIGKIQEQKGRKIYIHATLDDGGDVPTSEQGTAEGEKKKDPVVYATLEGLSIDGVKMSQHEDPVSKRTWEVEVCENSGRLQRRDSGWKLK